MKTETKALVAAQLTAALLKPADNLEKDGVENQPVRLYFRILAALDNKTLAAGREKAVEWFWG